MNYIDRLHTLLNKKNKGSLTLEDIVKLISIDKRLDTLEYFHGYLLDQVMKIHENEKSEINTALTKDNLSFADLRGKFENRKSGSGIYFIDNSKAESYVFGDVHGDSLTILHYLEKIDFINRIQHGDNMNLVFLGDYVDRGKKMFRILELLLILKYLFPENVFLIRGNHDGGKIISEDEYRLCVGRNHNTTDKDYFTAMLFNKLKKAGHELTLLRNYHRLFDGLCNIAMIYDKEIYLLAHAGITRPVEHKFPYIHSISDLTNDEIKDHLGAVPSYNMMWSDPKENGEIDKGRGRFYFYKEDFEEFRRILGFDIFLRGHEAFEEGAREFFDGRLITVFSSGKLEDRENDETAYIEVYPCYYEIHDGGKVMR